MRNRQCRESRTSARFRPVRGKRFWHRSEVRRSLSRTQIRARGERARCGRRRWHRRGRQKRRPQRSRGCRGRGSTRWRSRRGPGRLRIGQRKEIVREESWKGLLVRRRRVVQPVNLVDIKVKRVLKVPSLLRSHSLRRPLLLVPDPLRVNMFFVFDSPPRCRFRLERFQLEGPCCRCIDPLSLLLEPRPPVFSLGTLVEPRVSLDRAPCASEAGASALRVSRWTHRCGRSGRTRRGARCRPTVRGQGGRRLEQVVESSRSSVNALLILLSGVDALRYRLLRRGDCWRRLRQRMQRGEAGPVRQSRKRTPNGATRAWFRRHVGRFQGFGWRR